MRRLLQSLGVIVLSCLISFPTLSANKPATPLEKGKAIALKLCQACHQFKGANQAGTVAPPLASISQRFPQREKLREIIFDAQKAIGPDTMMPPFGRHGFVNKKETKLLIDFLYTL